MLLSTGGYGASGFGNDADGNTLVGNGRTNAWDSQNRLVSCLINGNTTAYKYGADGLRRQSTKNGVSTDYAYDGTMLVREGHATGGSLTASTVTATYFIGARGPEYRRDDTQTEVDSQGRTVTKARWYVYDGLGSVVGEVDPLGNLTSSPKYDVYGAGRSNGGTATSKQGFVGSLGHVSDTETGLVYMRARYYDPSAGRFVSEDPAGSGLNWYTYANNNPVMDADASGKAITGIGELDYDAAVVNAGFGLMALIVVIVGGYNARQSLVFDGVYLAEQQKREKTSQAGQQQWWDAALERNGLSKEDGREIHKAGISSRHGFDQDEIEDAMDEYAREHSLGKYKDGGGED